MARLPSGHQFTLDLQPWQDLNTRIHEDRRNRHSLRFLPEFLQVQRLDDLRCQVRLLWIVPMTADSARRPQFNHHAKRLKPGWIALDRGHTFDRLPEQLSARDRYRLNDLWQSAQFQQHLGAWLQIVTALRTGCSPATSRSCASLRPATRGGGAGGTPAKPG